MTASALNPLSDGIAAGDGTADSRLTARERSMVRDLVALIAERAKLEVEIEEGYRSSTAAAERGHVETRRKLDAEVEHGRRAAEKRLATETKRIEAEHEAGREKAHRSYRTAIATIAEKADVNQKATTKALQEAIWLAETMYEATETQPIEQYIHVRKGIDGNLEDVRLAEEQVAALLRAYRQSAIADGTGAAARSDEAKLASTPASAAAPAIAPPTPAPSSEEANPELAAQLIADLNDRVTEVSERLAKMQGLFIPRFFAGLWPIVFIIVIGGAATAAAALLLEWRSSPQIAKLAGGGILFALLALVGFYFVARAKLGRNYRPLTEAAAESRALAARCLRAAEQARERQKAQLLEQRDRDVKLSRAKYEPILAEVEDRRRHHFERYEEKYPQVLERVDRQRAEHLAELREAHDRQVTSLQESYERDTRELEATHAREQDERDAAYQRDWSALESKWKHGMASAYATAAAIREESERLFLKWEDAGWRNWTPPHEPAGSIRFGEMHIDLSAIPGGLPKDPRLIVPGPASFDLPALLGFPEPISMLIEASAEGRGAAVETLQTVMFRLLTSLPPGKVRFTIIDPVGLGQNFAGFMHLADYEGAFVNEKIWTEDRHIEQRLLDLTEHMENVIQKYLRNEYETIADYNVDAGEIAEPYRFLVIANFPVNFSETAARRLASIVNSGVRCGVYTLITVDKRQPMPQGSQLADLVKSGVHLVSNEGGFAWKDEDYAPFPLALDHPPSEALLTEKLHIIGEAAKDSTRVEVPFEVIAPPLEQYWTRDTTEDIHIALGRAGATKLQHLTLGHGTSQHALVAGKTGSGKSTLLHALITNLSLWYPPDEVEFYLVDFKKGVEFKTYATHNLPHARAVAIESDREFGLSVLQRLDAELKHRGNRYRELGVQDLAGYRRIRGGGDTEKMPRVLLIVDEFQELFTEDDKIAQDAALLLDRLVRQGRAFGMHVLLGSQTLGGAYSLARSTLGQMGVRIALQCSEADSYLILSDDNAAARLLARPGEAIYNDASGMIEGNNPFQVVWLPDDKREKYLRRVEAMARERSHRRPEPPIVFEGNVPAEISRNHLLNELLERSDWPPLPTHSSAVFAWLGDPIAIKDPTAAFLRRQSGNNLLIIGQREESALAMMTTSIIGLAAQHPPHGPGAAKFYILDGSPVDAPSAGFLGRLAPLLPHDVRNVAWREVAEAINEIARDLAQRQETHAHDAPPIYLIVYGLQRYRMLRQEDDFGFTAPDADAPPQPEKQFGDILREGPPLGVHTLVWCDTVNNLNRSLNRQGLREFEIRVLFQMGAADSSNLIDSPAAAKLGLHRALFFSEEQGVIEKFRPYALPDDGWLSEVAQRFARRAGNGARPK